MFKSFISAKSSEDGQSLVLILVIIVIGAVIAFSIAARTIQDIRRTGQERVSDQVGTQVETYLDGITSSRELTKIVDEEFNFRTGACSSTEDGGNICVLEEGKISEIFGDSLCAESKIKLRKDDDIIGREIPKDGVLQVDIDQSVSGQFNVSWTGSAHHLIIKVYYLDPVNNEILLYERPEAPVRPLALRAYGYGGSEQWGTRAAESGVNAVDYPANSVFARIRTVGGSAVIYVTDVSAQQLTVKASCTMSGIYREFVRVVPAYNALPAAFDYVLFDRNTAINEFN
jgi:hypothetical protein